MLRAVWIQLAVLGGGGLVAAVTGRTEMPHVPLMAAARTDTRVAQPIFDAGLPPIPIIDASTTDGPPLGADRAAK